MDITVQDCIDKAKMGWYAELNDGKLIGFQKTQEGGTENA